MLFGIISLSLYFIIMIILDFLPGRKKSPRRLFRAGAGSDEAYFLSGKTMPAAVLLISTAATNFSAFTILGLSGAGYRIGYAFYPVMAFGTGFMALGMYLTGSPLSRLGRERSYVSPVDYIADRYGEVRLTKLYAAVLLILTLPYLALQPMAAGMLLETSFGLPYRFGVILCSIVVGLYTTRGGMRAVARTDLFQGIIIVVLAAAAYAVVVSWQGGFTSAHSAVFRTAPELLSRFGGGAGLGPAALAGYIVLWFFADPMFPQLNQRFLAAKDQRSIERTVTIYPIVTMLLFFLTISVGVIGAGVLPGLSPAESDRIWPELINGAAGPALGAIFMIAPLAAIMSTLDSQLLTLSSIVTRDLLGKKDTGEKRIKLITALIAAAGLLIALFPPSNILDFINKSSFLGYAALAPVVFGGLYVKRFNRTGAVASIAVGEGLTLLSGAGLVSFGPVPPVFIICAASWIAMAAGSAVGRYRERSRGAADYAGAECTVLRLREKLPLRWAVVFGILFILGFDLIGYSFAGRGLLPVRSGMPGWLFYQAFLCLVLAAVFWLFFRGKKVRRD